MLKFIHTCFWLVVIFFALIIFANIRADAQFDQKHAQEQKAFDACSDAYTKAHPQASDLDVVGACP